MGWVVSSGMRFGVENGDFYVCKSESFSSEKPCSHYRALIGSKEVTSLFSEGLS
jgi:hypothetical protein